MRQRGHSHRHGGDEGPGQPEQQLHRQQEERQAEAQPHAGGKYRAVSDQHAEGERAFTALIDRSIFTVGTISAASAALPATVHTEAALGHAAAESCVEG